MDDLERQLKDALDLARKAKREFLKNPILSSQRGADTLSPWWKVWNEAVQNACRLQRLLSAQGATDATLEDELDELMRRGA